MEVRVTLSAEELVASVHEFLPYQVDISADGNQKRWLRVNAPESVEFIPKEGMRIIASATFHHNIPLVPDVHIRRSVLSMRPHLIDGDRGEILAFAVTLEELDLKGIPSFIDSSIVSRVNDQMQARQKQIAWDFSTTLNRTVGLGQRSLLIEAVSLKPGQATLTITDDSVVLALPLAVGFVRRPT